MLMFLTLLYIPIWHKIGEGRSEREKQLWKKKKLEVNEKLHYTVLRSLFELGIECM